ncbi:MAG: hypothetical protein IT406_03120 [Candidatus Yanofskybacteria bacterium]|nr:hypothetical protein [Candidatus Yanofskybacteria bacterium]
MQPLEIFGLALFSAIAGFMSFAIGSVAASAAAIAILLFSLGAMRLAYLSYRKASEMPPPELTAPEQLHRMVRMALTGNRAFDQALADGLFVPYPTLLRWSVGRNLPSPPIARVFVDALRGKDPAGYREAVGPFLNRIFFMEDGEMRCVTLSSKTSHRLWVYRADIGFSIQDLIDRIRVEQPWITEDTILAFLEARGY